MRDDASDLDDEDRVPNSHSSGIAWLVWAVPFVVIVGVLMTYGAVKAAGHWLVCKLAPSS